MNLRDTKDYYLYNDQALDHYKVIRRSDKKTMGPYTDMWLLNRWLRQSLEELNNTFNLLFNGDKDKNSQNLNGENP